MDSLKVISDCFAPIKAHPTSGGMFASLEHSYGMQVCDFSVFRASALVIIVGAADAAAAIFALSCTIPYKITQHLTENPHDPNRPGPRYHSCRTGQSD